MPAPPPPDRMEWLHAGDEFRWTATGQHRQLVQAIFDAAWDLGMRPTAHSSIADAMRASDAHLKDMRAIAFGKLGVTKP